MSKKPSPLATRQVLWFGWKLVIVLTVVLCLFALFRLQFQSELSTISSSRKYRHSFGEKFEGPPKIAFLFIARQNLPLDFLWGSFFENADAANFSIYVHSKPGFVFDESTTRSPLFYGRQLKNSIQVVWGESSMIAAERLLLEAALEDPANRRFVILSDSCVPLYNFSYIYNYVMASPRSFVDSFLDVKEGRYNPKMSPVIPKKKWRKGSQWITLTRSHAEVIVDDEVIFPVFKKLCKRRPPLDASKGKQNLDYVGDSSHGFGMRATNPQYILYPNYGMAMNEQYNLPLNTFSPRFSPMRPPVYNASSSNVRGSTNYTSEPRQRPHPTYSPRFSPLRPAESITSSTSGGRSTSYTSEAFQQNLFPSQGTQDSVNNQDAGSSGDGGWGSETFAIGLQLGPYHPE